MQVGLFNLMARLGMKSKTSNGGFLLSTCARILQNLDTLGVDQIKSVVGWSLDRAKSCSCAHLLVGIEAPGESW